MALKRIIPGGFVANRCKPAKWFTSPLVALGFFNASQGAAPSVPDAPTGFDVSIITGALRLYWDAVSGATSYNIYRSLAGGGGTLYQSGVTDLFFEDSSVTSGQSYFYEVTAVNGVGESARSTEVEEIPQLPANVTGFATASIGGNSVDLVWDTVAGVDWYVEVQLAGGDWSSPISNTPSAVNNLTVTGLSPSTTYDFRIQAQNSFGLSSWVELNGIATSMVTPEVSRIVTASDVGGSKHGKYFTLYDASGSVSITMNNSALAQRIHVDFTGPGLTVYGSDLVTSGEAYYVAIDLGSGLECFYFNTGSESQPAASFFDYHEVLVSTSDGPNDLAYKLKLIAEAAGLIDAGTSLSTCILESPVAGVVDAPISYPMLSSIEQYGRDAAASPGTASRNIFVIISDDLLDTDIASAIKSTLDSDGAWFCLLSGNTVDVTDIAAGARTDAVDVNTGFTISVIQQGGGSALIIDNDTLDLVFAWSPSRRVRTLHTGSLLRLRDSTNTTEGDVGYDGSNELDTTARDAIIGAHDATATKIYNQGPNALDVAQSTVANQPALKSGGIIQTINGKQGLLFDGVTDFMEAAAAAHGIGTNDFCISVIVKTDSSLGAWEGLFGFHSYAPGFYLNRGTKLGVFWGADYLSATTLATNTTYVLTFLRQSGQYKFYINGALDANTPSILFDNITDGDIHLMSDNGASDFAGGILLEAIMWKRVPANLAAIIANQKAFAGI